MNLEQSLSQQSLGHKPSAHKAHLNAKLPAVYFLGAGPGDPQLLTIRGAELLGAASAVVYDAPAHDDILSAFVAAGVERIDAATLGQAASTRGRRLAELALDHGLVVRIVSDDGVLFASTADEASSVNRNKVPLEIVPGVGVVASLGAFTGTEITGNRVRSLRLIEAGEMTHSDASKHRNTANVLTGSAVDLLAGLKSLAADGWDPELPVLLTSGLSTIHQSTNEFTLTTAITHLSAPADTTALGLPASSGAADSAAAATADPAPAAPTCGLLQAVLGQGAGVRRDLAWFETRPLFGWQVLIPRTKEQGSSTADLLGEYGAEGTVVPTIAIAPPRSPKHMERAMHALVDGDYQWIGFTSVNAVRAVKMWLDDLGLDTRALAGVRVAAVGGPTAEALATWGIEADLVPSGEHSARGLVADWPEFDKDDHAFNRVLLPRADIATEVLVAGLTELGWDVDDVTAYRTVRAAPPAAPVREAIKRGDFDAVLFTSSSTVRNLLGIAGKPPATTVVACIGQATAQTAMDQGLRVDVIAGEANLDRLVADLAEFARTQRDEQVTAGQVPVRPSQTRRRNKKRSVK